MLIFQVYAQKPEEADDEKDTHLGIKVKKRLQDAEAVPDEVRAAIPQIDKVFQKKGISEFITTLTPGAQNAIYAASFVWGYENAAKYVKSAMKIEEVKSAADSEERSRAVVENVCAQAQAEQPSVFKDTSSFVWGFYNEDMKETQAHFARSEHLVHLDAPKKEQLAVPELAVPLNPQEAVALSLASGSASAPLLYCASAPQVFEEQIERQAAIQKKEELARLIEAPRIGQLHSEAKKVGAEEAKEKEEEKVKAIAMQRRDELVEEYASAIKKMEEAIKVIDAMETDKQEELKKVASMLPSELYKLAISRSNALSSRTALRAQLVKWLAFAAGTRQLLKGLPPSKLLKLASLSSLLRLGSK